MKEDENKYIEEPIERFMQELVKSRSKEQLQLDLLATTRKILLAQRLLYNKKTLNVEDTKQLNDIFGF